MNVVDIFPTKIAVIDDVHCSSEISNYLNLNDHLIASTHPDGTVSIVQDTYILHNPFFSDLSSTIMQYVKMYAKNYLKYKYDDYQYSQSWVTFCAPEKQRHFAHTHPNSIITGVYYFQDTPSSPLVLHDVERSHFHTLFGSTKQQEIYEIECIKHRLVLIPSYQSHYVPTNTSNIARRSLAFNILPVGIIGNKFEQMDFSKLR